MSQNQNQEQKEKKPMTKITIQPAEMIATGKVKFISSNSLNKMVSKIFRPATPDFEGPRVHVNNNNEVCCRLYFSDNPTERVQSNQFKAIEPAIGRRNGEGNGSLALMKGYNRRNTTYRRYELTDKAKEALMPFIKNENKSGRQTVRYIDNGRYEVDWNRVVREEQDTAMYGVATKVYVSVPIDLTKLLKAVYGAKSEAGRYQYDISIKSVLNAIKEPNGNQVPTSWMLLITQINETTLNEVLSEMGVGTMQNSLGIYRG